MARRRLVALKPVDTRYQFGGAVGGPLLENRLFFFASHDQQRRNFPAISTTSDPAFFDTVDRGTAGAGLKAPSRALSDAQIDSTLAFLTSLTGEVPRRGDQTIYTPKVDWHMTSRHTLSATYNRLRWNSPAGIETAPTINRGRASFGDDFVNIDWITVGLVSRISSRLVNELRSQFGRDHEFQFSQTPAPGEPLTGPQGKPPETTCCRRDQLRQTQRLSMPERIRMRSDGSLPIPSRWRFGITSSRQDSISAE